MTKMEIRKDLIEGGVQGYVLLTFKWKVWPVWRNGRAFTGDPKGRSFESRPVRFRVTALAASCSHACASITKQYNLVPAYGL